MSCCEGCGSGKFGGSCCCASVTNLKGGLHPDSIRTVAVDITLEEVDASQTITHISKSLLHEASHIVGVDCSLVTIKRDTTVDNSEKQIDEPVSASDEDRVRANTPVNVSLYTVPGWGSGSLLKGGFGAIEQEQDRAYITTASLTAQNPSWTAHEDLFGYFADGGLFVEYNSPSDQYGVRVVVRYVPRLQFSPAYHDPLDVMQHYWKCSRGEAEFLEGFYAGTGIQVPSVVSGGGADTSNDSLTLVPTDDPNVNQPIQEPNLLLDNYTGAQAAYSVRKLDKDYAGNCLRVRNAESDAEADIGFDINGNLDRVAIANHCGSASGFVVTWYDQSGNSRHMTQSTAGSQPQIYNGTTTLTRNKRPVLNFDGKVLAQTGLALATSNGYTFAVAGSADGSSGYVVLASNYLLNGMGTLLNGNTGAAQLNNSVGGYRVNGAAPDSLTSDALFDLMGQQGLMTLSNHANTEGTTRYYSIGYQAMSTYDNLLMQELVIWHTDQSSNVTAIETDINAHYSIY